MTMTPSQVRVKHDAIKRALTKAHDSLRRLQQDCPHAAPEFQQCSDDTKQWIVWKCSDCRKMWNTTLCSVEMRKYPYATRMREGA